MKRELVVGGSLGLKSGLTRAIHEDVAKELAAESKGKSSFSGGKLGHVLPVYGGE
ncbi:hypothetical protein C5167_025094 [Papaver somniferum]|uniref:Uncharacterized protein n=1 Tax=Papaver somniferum TaxID=3469 RepID=A0A4Y7JTG7_PAPSO|nr:hypothetical protein C5167_025094 [Papaver somniferum]